MNSKFNALQELGAGEFEHLNGPLLKHLNATAELLKQWGANQTLCDAGLYHAAYGTAGFDTHIVSLNSRKEIANIIGAEAEAIVYLYCSCDRDFVFSQIGLSPIIRFKDRFVDEVFDLTPEQAKQFCELTVANELELAISSKEFLNTHGKGLLNLFAKFSPFITDDANNSIFTILG